VGQLVLLGLPIGNLGDISRRALDALNSGKIFIAEDTRNLKKIFNALHLETNGKEFLAFFDQSSEKELERCMRELSKGTPVYVVSDAGSAYISDPGFPLVREALRLGHEVDSIPGVTSVMMALELSGLPPIPFQFHGFLARKDGDIRTYLSGLGKGTHIFFESPNRFKNTVPLLLEIVGEVVLCRELTKMYQSVYRILATDVEQVEKIPELGEVVILFNLPDDKEGIEMNADLVSMAQEVLDSQAKPKKVAKLIASLLNLEVDKVYQALNRK
jgi:16S rRNA (cytidine1402-2'-O)-methyltransferase